METLQRTANRGSVSTGYDIDNSVKLEQPERLQRAYDGSGNIGSITSTDRKKTTLSYWVKRTQLNASGNGIVFVMYAGNTIMLGFENDKLRVSTSYGYSLKSNADFRDTSAWYHLVFSIDTTQGTANNRVKAYVNGAEVTSWGTQTISISQNANNGMFNEVNGSHYFGWSDAQATGCYLAEAHCIDGQALAASDFGEYDDDSGIWIPKEYTGTYGNQGYYLDFETSSNLGTDSSGNSNNFGALYGIGAENQATDTPTNNFCTLNPLHLTTRYTITEGGTNQVSSANGWGASVGSVGVTSGKWYFEVQSDDTNGYTLLGVIDEDSVIGTYVNGDAHAGDAPYGITYYGGGGSIITNGSAVTGLSFPTWTTETMGCALDLDNNKIYFSKSGTYGNSGDPAAGSNGVSLPTGGSGTWFISTSTYYAAYPAKTNQGGYTTISISSTASDSSGYGTFEYAPPTGYYALCTQNLAVYG